MNIKISFVGMIFLSLSIVSFGFIGMTFAQTDAFVVETDEPSPPAGIPAPVSELISVSNPDTIPKWVENLFVWYGEAKISETHLFNAIQFLINDGVIKEASIQPTSYNCSGTARCIAERVTTIIDGDTLYTLNYKIRLSLTDTPERGQLGYSQASDFTRNLCPVGSKIFVDQDDLQPTDIYGRILGKVICNGRNLNAELLENSLGVILTGYCRTSEFSSEAWAVKYGC